MSPEKRPSATQAAKVYLGYMVCKTAEQRFIVNTSGGWGAKCRPRRALQLCRARQTANVYHSNMVCEAAEQRCEDDLETEQKMRLPSTGRFR